MKINHSPLSTLHSGNPKVAIVCDWLLGTGGAERVVLELHKMFPKAPIYTSQYNSNPKIWFGDKWFEDADIRTGWLQKLPKGLKKFLPLLRAFYFSRLNLSNYDLVISSSGAEAKFVQTKKKVRGLHLVGAQGTNEDRKGAVHDSTVTANRSSQHSDTAKSAGRVGGSADKQAGAVHVSYCHSPTHYYWARYEEYLKQPGFGKLDFLARIGLRILVGPMRRWDYKAAQRPDYFIANSNYTKVQIKKYYGRDAVVIHPPVDIKRFQVTSDRLQEQNRRGFVTAGRQTPYKKIDLAVKAATELNAPLIVIGRGPDHKKLMRLAGRTVIFLTKVSDADKPEKFAGAEAFIFPGIDDFGIVAVEAMAAGTPIIAYMGGGALDYVNKTTGIFFDNQTPESLVKAMQEFNKLSFNHLLIAEQAKKFSSENFRQKISDFIKKLAK